MFLWSLWNSLTGTGSVSITIEDALILTVVDDVVAVDADVETMTLTCIDDAVETKAASQTGVSTVDDHVVTVNTWP